MLSLKKYKDYNAILFFHEDMDGVVSAIIFKEYLKQYGIKVIKYVPIQYGERWMYIAIKKWKIENPDLVNKTIFVLTDFSNSFINVEIHTDHHQKQYAIDKSQTYFKPGSKSNAEILNNISPYPIMNEEEIKYINMIDAAQYSEFELNPNELLDVVFKYDKTKSYKENKMYLVVVINNILIIYKNKMVDTENFLVKVVSLSKPSLLSIYNTILYILKNSDKENYKKILQLEEEMLKSYVKDIKKISNENEKVIINNYSDFKEKILNSEKPIFYTEENIVISFNNILQLWQLHNGKFQKIYNNFRYAPFTAYKNSIAVIKVFEDMGMIQMSYNPWQNSNAQQKLDLSKLKDKIFEIFDKYLFINKTMNLGDLLYIRFSKEKIKKQEDLLEFTINDIMDFFNTIKPILNSKTTENGSLLKEFNDTIKNKSLEEFEKILLDYKEKLNNYFFHLKDYCKLLSGGHTKIYNFVILPIIKKECKKYNILMDDDYIGKAAYTVYNEFKKELLKDEYK